MRISALAASRVEKTAISLKHCRQEISNYLRGPFLWQLASLCVTRELVGINKAATQ
jgi:hypothetical protein